VRAAGTTTRQLLCSGTLKEWIAQRILYEALRGVWAVFLYDWGCITV